MTQSGKTVRDVSVSVRAVAGMCQLGPSVVTGLAHIGPVGGGWQRVPAPIGQQIVEGTECAIGSECSRPVQRNNLQMVTWDWPGRSIYTQTRAFLFAHVYTHTTLQTDTGGYICIGISLFGTEALVHSILHSIFYITLHATDWTICWVATCSLSHWLDEWCSFTFTSWRDSQTILLASNTDTFYYQV